jgi:hypothetical protein
MLNMLLRAGSAAGAAMERFITEPEGRLGWRASAQQEGGGKPLPLRLPEERVQALVLEGLGQVAFPAPTVPKRLRRQSQRRRLRQNRSQSQSRIETQSIPIHLSITWSARPSAPMSHLTVFRYIKTQGMTQTYGVQMIPNTTMHLTEKYVETTPVYDAAINLPNTGNYVGIQVRIVEV